ncbi:TVP38/TMEM64 family protein [Reinekea sp. G2M2-21]|uniref:TVP38/TMEM64 family protein n=1 Tax=Reinekea sp. G2M2-21 TaxID=2788942 RepID=UPI0018AC13BC|nr:TVP38/TMEM64 family protein [Reinekea sp. G2M2-21]
MKKFILLGVFAIAVGAYFYFDLGQWLTLDQLKAQQTGLEQYRAQHPVLVALVYILTYIVVTALSLPGATILTLSGGAIFGVVWGTVFANISATIGATLAFLIARFVIGDWVQQKFGERISVINKGIEQDGAFYLFSLRLVPLFPFFIINVVMGLTKIKTLTFFWVSSVGMIAGAAVYANAGTQLAKLDSLAGIASPGLLISFALLGLFPLIARKGLDWLKSRREALLTAESER